MDKKPHIDDGKGFEEAPLNREQRRAMEAKLPKAERDALAALKKAKAAAQREQDRRQDADEIAREKARETFMGEYSHRRLNIYTCDTCREHIVTEDIDRGVTPFLISCEYCTRGKMRSSMYRVFDLSMKEGYHWYTPSADELERDTPWAREHVEKGGLLLRKADGTVTNAQARRMVQQ